METFSKIPSYLNYTLKSIIFKIFFKIYKTNKNIIQEKNIAYTMNPIKYLLNFLFMNNHKLFFKI